jgi:membrane-associated protein
VEVLLDYFINLDQHMAQFVAAYGLWIYVLLFLIIFAETGLIITPFLPGDSLLFAAGAMAAGGSLNLTTLFVLLTVAAIIGDAVNYSIGRYIGPRVFRAVPGEGLLGKALNRDHLTRAHDFFERYGGKAIILARFAPIVRTFVPFVAGVGSMTYSKFAFYNVTGAILWVGICTGAGYAFGNIPVVKDNFSLVVLGIVAVSILPMALEMMRGWRASQASS